MRADSPIDRPWMLSADAVTDALGVDRGSGLDSRAVQHSRQRHGANQLREIRPKSVLRILLDQFSSLMMLLLTAAAAVAFLMVDWVEGTAIAVVIAVNAALGFFTEWRAIRSMEALHGLSETRTRVRRNGRIQEVSAADLVVGDVVLLEGGDVVTADLRLTEASRLQANESALTGESAPVEKRIEAVPDDTPLAERASMLYKGTAITRGSGEGVVVGVGLTSELGRITALVATTDSAETPLELRLEQLGRRLIYVTLGLTAAVAAVGIALGRDTALMIETAIALAVATVPEGLPVVATIALARGLWRMARRNALVNRLSAVETLGATGVILTDKTGTLTENRMELVRLISASHDVVVEAQAHRFVEHGQALEPAACTDLLAALEIGVLCNNAAVTGDGTGNGAPSAVGDPMETALLTAAQVAGLSRAALLEREPELREEAFDPEAKMMATFHRGAAGQVRVTVKGAPEAVLDACTRLRMDTGEPEFGDGERQRWLRRNETLAGNGSRVLALAEKYVDSESTAPYEALVFVALAVFLDPPRSDVKPALDECRAAGIRLVMVTGDQAPTALHVARAVGLADGGTAILPGGRLAAPERLDERAKAELLAAGVFSRVSPEQKLNLIALHQAAGHVVAMTGDGVNDAPALKKADIGVAMGQRGTQVAREAADMVLKDDAFSTIVVAVRQGRVIFENIRKFVLYLLSCNVSEVLVVALATIANAPLPILPLQILFLNLVTDVFPALALGVGPGDEQIMKRRPRPAAEAILTAAHWRQVGWYGALITVTVLSAFGWALYVMELSGQQAVTVSFLTLALAQLWHVFNMRDPDSTWRHNEITGNGYVWGALALCVGLLLAAVYLPLPAEVLRLARPDGGMWTAIAFFSSLPWVAGQLWLTLRRRRDE